MIQHPIAQGKQGNGPGFHYIMRKRAEKTVRSHSNQAPGLAA
jgi:hypothetical protein